MKNFLLMIFLFTLYSCGNKKAQVEQIKREDKLSSPNNIEYLLKGAWAENEKDNALFSFDGQYINYTEGTKPYTYKVTGDTVTLNLQPIARLLIIKISKDSLWFTDNFSTDTTKLYRR